VSYSVGPELANPEDATQPVEEGPDYYEQTRFWRAARVYGFRDLIVTPSNGLAVATGGALFGLYLSKNLKVDGAQALGVAYASLGAALFGIVLAGLAVVAAFFDREYVAALREVGSLRVSLFGFWWVAALSVGALVSSVALTVAAFGGASRVVVAVVLTLATVSFFAALLGALELVGTLMRHGLYRAELAGRGIRIGRSAEPSEPDLR